VSRSEDDEENPLEPPELEGMSDKSEIKEDDEDLEEGALMSFDNEKAAEQSNDDGPSPLN